MDKMNIIRSKQLMNNMGSSIKEGWIIIYTDIATEVITQTTENIDGKWVFKQGEELRKIVTDIVTKRVGNLYSQDKKDAIIDFFCNNLGKYSLISPEWHGELLKLHNIINAEKIAEKTATKSVLAEVGEVAAETMTKPKSVLGIVGGVLGGAALNVLLDDSHKVIADGHYHSDKVSNFYRSKFTEDEFDKAFALYEILNKPRTEKDFKPFYQNPAIYIYTIFAKDEKIKNMTTQEIKYLIELSFKYGKRNPLEITVTRARCWEALENRGKSKFYKR